MAKTKMEATTPKGKKEVHEEKKPKEFTDLVIKEMMVQKNMTYDQAKAHLEKYHR